MKNIKRILALVLVAVLAFAFVACTNSTNGDAGSTQPLTSEQYKGEKIKVATLKGPTGIGMVDLMANSNYEMKLISDPTQIASLVATGEVDIAACPLNLASNLYKKTNGGVQMLGINTLGVLYVVSNGIEINSIDDLKGQTVYSTGAGATPEFILNYILSESGIKDQVKVEYLSEHSELATKLISGEVKLAVLPEPFVSVVNGKNSAAKPVLSLTDEWSRISPDTELAMGCVVVRSEFAKKNPQAVAQFVADNKLSVENANVNPTAACDKAVANGIFDEGAFAVDPSLKPKKAEAAKLQKKTDIITRCNIVFIDGEEMKQIANANLSVYFNADPKSIGGELPADGFYYAS